MGAKNNFIASGDIQVASYHSGLPPELEGLFTMPATEAWRLGLSHVGDRALEAGDFVMPEVCVLLMGWTHALHCCQPVLQHAMWRARTAARIGDGQQHPYYLALSIHNYRQLLIFPYNQWILIATTA